VQLFAVTKLHRHSAQLVFVAIKLLMSLTRRRYQSSVSRARRRNCQTKSATEDKR